MDFFLLHYNKKEILSLSSKKTWCSVDIFYLFWIIVTSHDPVYLFICLSFNQKDLPEIQNLCHQGVLVKMAAEKNKKVS